MRKRQKIILKVFVWLSLLISSPLLWAGITGSISGIVTDPSGAVVVGATVTVVNPQTGINSAIHTDKSGFYNFPDLAVGTYDLQVAQTGFRSFEQKTIVVEANSAIRIDVHLNLGEVSEKVTVTSQAVRVESQSTQMGEVIDSRKMTAVPLNGRDFTQMIGLAPGFAGYSLGGYG